MSSIRYADRIRCDYPDCQSVADATVNEGTFTHKPPDGWLSMGGRSGITIMTAYGQHVGDLCSLHSSIPVDRLDAAFAPKEASASGNRN